jgi:CMP-N-acetylneuraminic acid synthetase
MSAIAFIPARKNSKRLPGKNKKLLNGIPLFQYTVEAALKSKCYQMVVLTTDDEKIVEIGKRIDGLTVLARPDEYATDDVRAKDVILYHLDRIDKKFDYVSLLMPTSPFRDATDIRRTFEVLQKESGESIASVVKYDFHPEGALRIMDNRLYSYFHKEFRWIRENEFDKAYHLNGAIFTSKTNLLTKTRSFVHNGTIPYLMGPLKSLDIDEESDFIYAEFILREKLL